MSQTKSTQPYTARWGIMACGGIASTFTKDLLLDPASRQVDDVRHSVVAVASSSSVDKARKFIVDNKCDEHTKPYGSYEELVKDDDVEIVYVASPHAQHYENVLLALRNGKNVCCEKPFTINAEQTKHLVKVAQEKNLFLMEAVWIRFFPLVIALQKTIHQDRAIGDLVRVESNFGIHFPFDEQHRLYNPSLGGGALLDLGLYPATWLMMTLYADPSNEKHFPTRIASNMVKVKETQVDAQSVAVLTFDKLQAAGTLSANLRVTALWSSHHTLIQGTKGTITVHGRPYRPESFKVYLNDADGNVGEPQEHAFDIPGHGMFWEADACARDLRDGKKQDDRCSWQDSIATMTVLDTVRQQNDFRYPEAIEMVQSS